MQEDISSSRENRPDGNQVIENINIKNLDAIEKAKLFREDKRTRDEKYEDFSRFKHKYPFNGYVPCRAGSIDFTLFHANDDIVAWEYFWFGDNGYEREIVNTWLDWCKHPNTVLDIGGYSGLMSILAARANYNTKVEMFEPMERIIERAKINLKANNVYHRVKLCNKAASDSPRRESINLPREENFLGTGNSIYDKGLEIVDVKEIECVKVDDFIENKMPGIVKIDIEGHELACLKGMQRVLSDAQPKIIIEVWEHTRTEVLQMLKDFNYVCQPFELSERRVMNYRCEPK
jgi:FkbM family methyltransferase